MKNITNHNLPSAPALFPWFKRSGLLYRPVHVIGWIIFMAALGYTVYSFIAIDSHSHSVSDTLMNFTFRLFLIAVVYFSLGLLTSRNKKK